MQGKACLYKCYEKGRYIGIMTSAEAEERTGLPRNRVNRYARERKKYRDTYRYVIAGDKK